MRPGLLLGILDRELGSALDGQHTPTMLWGPPGVGKSEMVAQVAARHHVPIIDLRLSQMEPSDLRGIPFRSGTHVEWAIPNMLPDAERHGPAGILFLDEVTSAAPTVSAAAYQLILDRRVGDYQLPPGWAIVAAGNRQGDRGVTYAMPAPLANRFAHYEVDVHLDDWVSWAFSQGIDERIIGFLRFRPDRLFQFDPTTHQTAFPSPRTWAFADRALKKFGSDSRLSRGALQACVGEAAGVELHAYLCNLENLPDLSAILRGEPVPPPAAVDLQYAVASALVGHAIRAQREPDAATVHGHILSYAGQFPQREMGVMLVADMHRAVGDALFEVPAFADWANVVAELVLERD